MVKKKINKVDWEIRYKTLFSELWKEGYTPKEIYNIAKNMKLIVSINYPTHLRVGDK